MPSVLDNLKNSGLKATPQRIAIMDYLSNNFVHPDADTIYNALRKNYPTISLATVYNTLEILTKNEQLVKLSIDPEKAHYDYITEPHFHFLCRQCGTIYDLKPSEKLDPGSSTKHIIEETQAYFKGICANCNKQGGEK